VKGRKTLGELLEEWARENDYDEDAVRFYRILGEYLETGRAPEWWIKKCKKLKILDEKGRLIVEEFPPSALELHLLGLVWMGIVERRVVS